MPGAGTVTWELPQALWVRMGLQDAAETTPSKDGPGPAPAVQNLPCLQTSDATELQGVKVIC